MTPDEQQIRQLVSSWWSASKAGDVETVLPLMTDDVVFLVAGRPPMGKREFAALAHLPEGAARPTIDSHAEIKEVCVCSDLAYLWAELRIVVTGPGAATPIRRAGHTLTVFRRVSGRWLVARDANLLVTQG